MNRTWVILTFLITGCASVPDQPGAPDQPNIVFIIADDLGIGDTGVYGSEVIQTPNIDALAQGGVRMTDGYVSHPVCSPSRAGLLTGRYQQRHGWEFNPAGRDVQAGMSRGESTFADAMKARGYATGMIGKWHLGYQSGHHPLDRGFDEYFGVLAGGSIFIDPEAPGVESVGKVSRYRSARVGITRQRVPVKVDEYLTDAFTNEATAFIQNHAREPFLLYVSHTTPHTPLQATAKYLDRYRHIDDKATRVYAAMVSSLDDSVGAIVKALRDTGQYENTLIVFMSDNGCAGYIGNACSNGPHAGFKRYHQEGGIRVPFIVHWPAGLPGGTMYSHPVISLDLLATFTAAAGDSETTEDSVNLLPYLRGERDEAPHDYLYWRAGPTKAIRDDRWKLIVYHRAQLTRDDLGADGRLKPPAGGWPLDAPGGTLTLLYDLDADPGETTNLASAYPGVVERLMAVHTIWAGGLAETPILPPLRSTVADMHGELVQLLF